MYKQERTVPPRPRGLDRHQVIRPDAENPPSRGEDAGIEPAWQMTVFAQLSAKDLGQVAIRAVHHRDLDSGVLRRLQKKRGGAHGIAEPANSIFGEPDARSPTHHRADVAAFPPAEGQPGRVALAMSAEVEEEDIVPTAMEIAAQCGHLEPRAPHAVNQDDQPPTFRRGQIPAPEHYAVTGLGRPGLRVLAHAMRV